MLRKLRSIFAGRGPGFEAQHAPGSRPPVLQRTRFVVLHVGCVRLSRATLGGPSPPEEEQADAANVQNEADDEQVAIDATRSVIARR